MEGKQKLYSSENKEKYLVQNAYTTYHIHRISDLPDSNVASSYWNA